MAESIFTPAPKKRGGWLRKLGWLVILLGVLLVAIYFVATSAAFLKGVILPRVGQAMNADVTVADAQISPFSQVRLLGLKVQPRGGETLLTVPEVRVRYGLWQILGGKIVVAEAVIESPVVTVIQNADGTSNLDPLLKNPATRQTQAASKPAAASAKPPQVDIKKIALNNATVRLVKNYPGGGRDVTEVTGLNFSASDIRNGQPGKIAIAAALAVEKAASTNAVAATLHAKLLGTVDFALTPELKFGTAQGSTTLTVEQAGGALADWHAFAAKFDCELTPTELKQLALRFTKADAVLAEIHARGPFDTAKSEGKIRLEVLAIDRQALNLIGAASGLDFGTTTISSTNDIEFSRGGSLITAAGRLDIGRFQVTRQNQSSPTLDVHGDYAVTVDQTAASAVVQTLNLTGTQNSQPLLQGALTSPMSIAWGNASSAVGEAALNLTVTGLNLADWKAFTGAAAPEGVVGVKAKLVSQKSGRQLAFDLTTHVDNLATGPSNARVNQGNVSVQAHGSATDLKQFKLDDYQLELVRQGASCLKVSGTGTFDSGTQDADFTLTLQTALAQLLNQPAAKPANDAISLKARVTHKQNKITLAGQLALTPTARAKNEVQLDGTVDLTVAAALTGSVKVSGEAVDVTSYYDLISAGQTNAINQAAANAPAATVTTAADPNREPDAIKLPLKNFRLDLNVGHLFLREVDIANWQTTALLDGGQVLLKPCQFTLNGAPVKAVVDLNLGVPGYVYDVNFSADAIPLPPLVNSFAPDRKGQIGGTTSAHAQLKGAGVTGTGLQKNLVGHFDFATTNMNLSLANVRSPLINSVLNVVVRLPDLLRNPAATLGNMLGGAKQDGWADQLTAKPIDVIAVNAEAGEGRLQLQPAEIRSAAFQVLATGQVAIAPILTNSVVQIPVQIKLARVLANQVGLVSSDTPTNATYAALPDFLKLKGTVGNPKTDLDKRALVLIAAKAGGGVAGQIGGSAGEQTKSAFSAVEGLFKSPSGTNSNPATNASPAGSLLNLFKK